MFNIRIKRVVQIKLPYVEYASADVLYIKHGKLLQMKENV